MAQSMDGHTVNPDGKWNNSSSEDKRRMDRLRSWADYIITGRKSIDQDNPNLTIRDAASSKRHPVPVVLLQSKDKLIEPDARIWNFPHPAGIIGIYDATEKECRQYHDALFHSLKKHEKENGFEDLTRSDRFKNKWKVLPFTSAADLIGMLPAVSQKSSYRKKILLEGGPKLNDLFFREDLIDEIFFTVVPWVFASFGEDRIITTTKPHALKKFRLINVERRKDEVFLRYKKILNNY